MSRSIRLALVAVLLLLPVRAWAHAHLKRSDPASGSRVSALSVIRLWFTERAELAMTSVSVTDAVGARLTLGPPVRGSVDALEIDVPVTGQLAPGTYTVSWSTVASDGHPSRGSFKFVVIAATTTALVSPPPDTPLGGTHAIMVMDDASPMKPLPDASSAAHSLLRAAEFVALLSLVGVVAFCLLVLPRASNIDATLRAAMERRAAMLGIAATTLLILSALAHLSAGSEMANEMSGTHSMTSTEMAMHTHWGNALRMQIVAAMAALVGFAVAFRRIRWGWLVAGVAALVIAVTPALSGHAGAAARFPFLMVANDFLHVISGGVWLGSLVCILTIGIPTAFSRQETNRWLTVASLVNVFSPIALTAASVVIASGILASWIHLQHFSALWQSRYGQMLLRKLFFVAVVVLVGAYNYKRIQPQLTEESGARRLRRSAILELVSAVVVLIFTGFLTGIEP